MIKNTFIFAVIFGVLAAVAFAAVSTGDYRHPDHPGKCYITPDIIVGPGTHQYPGDCARIICGKGGFAEIQSCGVQIAGPGCKLGKVAKPDADYPDCCLREIFCE